MNKSLITISLALALLSSNATAITNGTPLNWVENDDLIENECTGTILGGKWILTAAHCRKNTSGTVKFSDGSRQSANQHIHPNYDPDLIIDIALWELPSTYNVSKATFISLREVNENEKIRITGFGQTAPLLNYAIQSSTAKLDVAPHRLALSGEENGWLAPGDSGSPMLDTSNRIVGVATKGAKGLSSGLRINVVSDFILDTVDSWHHPTVADTEITGGTITIEVQSLHKDTFIDNATASGDATITGGTCSGATVQPFDICTYTVSSNGYEGTVTLDADQKITINKGRTQSVTPPPEPEQGSSGGALSSLSLLFGLLTIFTRRKTTR